MPTTKLTAKKSIQERLFSQAQDSEYFPVSVGICPAFLPETAVKVWSNASESAIVVIFFHFCSRDSVVGREVFNQLGV